MVAVGAGVGIGGTGVVPVIGTGKLRGVGGGTMVPLTDR